MNIDNEILQDFLVEAGELFDQLNDQFVELDKDRTNSDMINAIFRAYHTIKGGAGFMKLTPMVEVCHRAEDVINQVRQKEREVTDEMIDVMFQVLDDLELMFSCIRDGKELSEADESLIRQLDMLLECVTVETPETNVDNSSLVQDEIQNVSDMDDEFEEMLVNVKDQQVATDDITDDEFEDVLDSIHGKGKHSDSVLNSKQKSEMISDEEFEAALDNIHGIGKGPAAIENVSISEKNPPENCTSISEISQKENVISKVDNKKKADKSDKPIAETTVRVDTSRLDDIMNLVGELVLVRNRLITLKAGISNDSVQDAISTLDLVTSELQGSVMKTRMQPIKKVFSRFPRVIRDLARKLDKDINLELIGEETDLDKSLVEALADPLIHLVRNAADHGIEAPQERFESGKPRQGNITLSAKQEGDQILLTVCDDGKGMDHKQLRKKAVEKGMMSDEAANKLSNKEAYNLIFAPGFSTMTEISDVSGRGVGMDVVKTRINELNGNVEIDSELGEGSMISIYLPLTLAILPTLMVRIDQYQFALPLSNVLEAFNMEPDKVNIIDGQKVIRVRDKPLPLFFLGPWLLNSRYENGDQSTQKVIVVQMGNQRFCLVVDQIAGQEEVVIKPLGTMLTKTKGFAGATITGDGSIALIIDVPGLIVTYAADSGIY